MVHHDEEREVLSGEATWDSAVKQGAARPPHGSPGSLLRFFCLPSHTHGMFPSASRQHSAHRVTQNSGWNPNNKKR